MFTERAQDIITAAKDWAFSCGREQITAESIAVALVTDMEGLVRLAECFGYTDSEALVSRFPALEAVMACPGRLDYSSDGKALLGTAQQLAGAQGCPDLRHPGLINIGHLACAAAMAPQVCALLPEASPISMDEVLRLLSEWDTGPEGPELLAETVGRLRELRRYLLSNVFGQDHAIYAFIEGLYESFLTGNQDRERKRPAAVFVFAGPPAVGKTYTVELASAVLKRPFKRFDMTGYTDHQSHNQLVGFAPSYKDAHEGLLTGFVEQNPNAILLFDEIEKAHLNVVQFFYQILDAGHLEDKFTERNVSFRDAIIIFTTNAGRMLYDNKNRSGITTASAVYHRQTILTALENEKNPVTGLPAFPPAICSRLAQGFPVLFNHLKVNELERVSAGSIRRVTRQLEQQYFKHIVIDPLLPTTLVLESGALADARQIATGSQRFIKNGLLSFASLYEEMRLEDVLKEVRHIRFELEMSELEGRPEIASLFSPLDKQDVLLVAQPDLASAYMEHAANVHWHTASNTEEAMDLIISKNVDLVLLDLWLGHTADNSASKINTLGGGLDYIPFSARALSDGRDVLRSIRKRFPQIPVYLLSFQPQDDTGEQVLPGVSSNVPRPIDDELFLECFRAGGARGLLRTGFTSPVSPQQKRTNFQENLDDILGKLYREAQVHRLQREQKTLAFDVVPRFDKESKTVLLRLRDFRLQRVVNADDAAELIQDVERPQTRFSHVYGAEGAKRSMHFIVDWLRNPKRFAALGLRPPKGVLLTGPPGTGKTMLARALAGESDCAFIEKSATSFVTIWQGSGPQNIRDLFARARRYAPSIIFIDEIDAIGVARGGGHNRAAEETLNALLTEMDGFTGAATHPVIVMAATNLGDHLDPALKRRFDRQVEVDKPDRDARLRYLEDTIKRRRAVRIAQETLERMAGQSTGMTIADLERVLQEAGVNAAQCGSALTDTLLEEAFETIRMGDQHKAPPPATLERIARHESGHALVAHLGGNTPVQITIVGRGGMGGFMERKANEEEIIHTKTDLEQRIREAMGGRAAELIYYGDAEGLSSGASGDLQHATEIATRMVCDFGMDGQLGHIAIPAHLYKTDGPVAMRCTEQVQTVLASQMKIAMAMLLENRSKLDRLSQELLAKNRLTRDEIKEIINESPSCST